MLNSYANSSKPTVSSRSVSSRANHVLVKLLTATTQPYLDSEMQSRWFDFGGDTIIRTDKYIRLTADKPSRAGYIFSRVPLTATNWEVRLYIFCAVIPWRFI